MRRWVEDKMLNKLNGWYLLAYSTPFRKPVEILVFTFTKLLELTHIIHKRKEIL